MVGVDTTAVSSFDKRDTAVMSAHTEALRKSVYTRTAVTMTTFGYWDKISYPARSGPYNRGVMP